jgi:phage shock protein PspC (stress-responsive transcriptional regulator)
VINPFKEVNWNPDTAERRSFGKSLIIGFPCLALFWLIIGRYSSGEWHLETAAKVAGIGAGLGVLFFILPVIARPFYVVWYCFACCIGLVMGNVILSAVYYIFVTSLGLILRACGKKPIRKTLDRQAATYWLDAGQPTDPRRYFHQF